MKHLIVEEIKCKVCGYSRDNNYLQFCSCGFVVCIACFDNHESNCEVLKNAISQ